MDYGKIKCPKCGSLAKILGMSETTTMGWSPGYYDETGEFHWGTNANIITQHFTCMSCGETYIVKEQNGRIIEGDED